MVRIQYFTNFVLNEIEEKHKNIYLDLVVLGKLISVCLLVVKTHLFASVFLLGADMMLAEVMGDENVKCPSWRKQGTISIGRWSDKPATTACFAFFCCTFCSDGPKLSNRFRY